jgi:hypothetical protein
MPPAHGIVPKHALPHPPQFARSATTLMQVPPQRSKPVEHGVARMPSMRVRLAAHTVPQLPQWLLSERVLTQLAPHIVLGSAQPASASPHTVCPARKSRSNDHSYTTGPPRIRYHTSHSSRGRSSRRCSERCTTLRRRGTPPGESVTRSTRTRRCRLLDTLHNRWRRCGDQRSARHRRAVLRGTPRRTCHRGTGCQPCMRNVRHRSAASQRLPQAPQLLLSVATWVQVPPHDNSCAPQAVADEQLVANMNRGSARAKLR